MTKVLFGASLIEKALLMVLAGLLSPASTSAITANDTSPEIWMLAAPHRTVSAPGWEGVRTDAGDMWKPNAPWETVARSVKVIQFAPTSVDRASANDLKEAVADVKRRNIALAIGDGLLIRSDRCRSKTEAYVNQPQLEGTFQKLKNSGADVKYVTMDEPFFYGHRDSSPTSCHESPEALAHALAQSIEIVRKYFPNAQFGADEVIDADMNWVQDLARWTDTYRAITGEPLAYIHADLDWSEGAARNLVPLAAALKQRHIALGVIYDADRFNNNSDENWSRNTVAHFAKVESELRVHPDQAVIESWVKFPTRMLPQNQPATLTNVVLQYIRQHETPARGQTAVTGSTFTPETWFFLRGYTMNAHGVDGQQGWRKLFLEPDAPWPPFMNHVQVLALAGNITVPDDVYAKAFAKLKEKHIGFALESLAQSWVGYQEFHCGKGVEGYTDPPGNAQIARKIKAAGGELSYVTMDGPLFSGHYYNGQNACHSSIHNVADRAAAVMREYQKVFPNVIIGDTEPFPALAKQPNWRTEYKQWLDAFKEVYGRPIGFLIIDINWPEDNWHWQQSLQQVVQFARENHLQVGIIYNAAFPEGAKSDEQWLNRAVDNFSQIEGRMGIVPDKALFESWTFFPKRSLSEQGTLGEDYLVKRYLQMHGVEIDHLRSGETR